MKATLSVLVLLTSISLVWAAELVFFHNFEMGMPSGWITQGPPAWQISNTANAGAESPELMLSPVPGSGVRRFISPAINTLQCFELVLMFWHSLDCDPFNEPSPNFSLDVSTDGASWTSLWSIHNAEVIIGQYVSVTIPRAFLETSTFYLSFACDGQTGTLNSWYLDDLHLVVTEKIASGIWTKTSSPYWMHCDYVVPTGYEWVIEPGVELYFDSDCGIEVYGQMQANGNAADSISFAPLNEATQWQGIILIGNEADMLEISYCVFRGCNTGSLGSGALYIDTSGDVTISYCVFSNNTAGSSGALFIASANEITIQHCRFDFNCSHGGSTTLYAEVYDSFTLTHTAFNNNYNFDGYGFAHVAVYPQASNVQAFLYANTFANNETADAAIAFMGNQALNQQMNNMSIEANLFWNPNVMYEAAFNQAFGGSNVPTFSYCNIDSQKIYGIQPVIQNCIDVDPQFVDYEDPHLLGTSPCFNTGPVGHLDPDGTRKDIGAYPINTQAVIKAVQDVPYDQGRKVEVFWQRSELDNTFMPGAFYSVWRGDSFRSVTGTVISSPLELGTLSDLMDVWWIDRNIAWNYMGQLPAYNFTYYGFISPTLQDSSATGINAAPFRVVYQWANGFSTSADLSGYSVDNIPPDRVTDLMITKLDTQIRLNWSAVTTGTFNGTSYPEINGVWYKIFCSDEPFFEIGPASYLTTTATPFLLCDYLSENRKFFRVVTADQ